MSGAQSGMLEDANNAASRDQTALKQVQQTAATGEALVQGMPLHTPSCIATSCYLFADVSLPPHADAIPIDHVKQPFST